MVGTHRNAAAASRIAYGRYSFNMPFGYSLSGTKIRNPKTQQIRNYPGWFTLAQGSTRMVFLGPDKVVYKVGSYANRDEYSKYRSIAASPKKTAALLDLGFAIPRMSIYRGEDDVLAVQYIEGPYPSKVPEVFEMERLLGIDDVADNNFNMVEWMGLVWLIDIGSIL